MRATDVLLRRVRHFQLTTKNGPRDYYKGTRTGAMGQHTHKGGYKVDFEKVRTYVMPAGLNDFKVSRGWRLCARPLRAGKQKGNMS